VSLRTIGPMIASLAALVWGASASADSHLTSCTMAFESTEWALVVEAGNGQGKVTCENGQSADVRIELSGLGAALGEMKIDKGRAVFTNVKSIDEVFGSYTGSGGGGGAIKAGGGAALTKGDVSVVLYGVGRGMDLTPIALEGLTVMRKK